MRPVHNGLILTRVTHQRVNNDISDNKNREINKYDQVGLLIDLVSDFILVEQIICIKKN